MPDLLFVGIFCI